MSLQFEANFIDLGRFPIDKSSGAGAEAKAKQSLLLPNPYNDIHNCIYSGCMVQDEKVLYL